MILLPVLASVLDSETAIVSQRVQQGLIRRDIPAFDLVIDSQTDIHSVPSTRLLRIDEREPARLR